jgi:GNAT superfamily N-acetyltransferase
MEATARLRIESDLAPTAEDMARVRAGLTAFNDSQAGGPAQVVRVAVYLRDAHDVIQGGLVGFLAWQWLSVEYLWVGEALRGRGHGSALLRQAEAIARDAGCVAVKLDTYEFQAKPFYEKLGYRVFGVLEGYPSNTRTYYLHKSL